MASQSTSTSPPPTDPPDSGGANTSRGSRVLLNNLVLDKIAKRLPPGDLFLLRSTAPAWNRAFIPELRKTHRAKTLDKNYDCGHRLMQEYTEIMRTSTAILFGRYKFYDLPSEEQHSHFDEFFRVCGQTVSKIKLMCCGPNFGTNSSEGIKRIRRMIFELTPNLENLHIAIVPDIEPPLPPPTLVKVKVEKDGLTDSHDLPNLKRLRLDLLDCNIRGILLDQFKRLIDDVIRGSTTLMELYLMLRLPQGFYFDNLPALEALRDHSLQLNNLKSLKICYTQDTELKLLSELGQHKINGLHLTEFVLSVQYNEELDEAAHHTEALCTFLATQTSSLRRLSIRVSCSLYFGDDDSRVAVRLPRLTELRTLKLSGEGQFDVHFEGGAGRRLGRLSQAFPGLRHLDLEWNLVEGEEGGDVLQVSQLAHQDVTELTLAGILNDGWVWSQDSDWRLTNLAERLPSVTQLRAFIPSDHLPQCIWICWPALTILHIEYKTYDILDKDGFLVELDEWLSGIPKLKHQSLESEVGYQKVISRANLTSDCDNTEALEQIRSLHARWKSLPGISDLRCLRKFTLIILPLNPRYNWNCSLADIGGYFGLAMANSRMESLIIRNDNEQHQFLSSGCKSLIRFALGPTAVIEPDGERSEDVRTLLSHFSPGLK